MVRGALAGARSLGRAPIFGSLRRVWASVRRGQKRTTTANTTPGGRYGCCMEREADGRIRILPRMCHKPRLLPPSGKPWPRSGQIKVSAKQDGSFFTPAVNKGRRAPGLLRDPRRHTLRAAPPRHLPTPTRRGPQTVASECGTSMKILSDYYAFAIEDLRENGPTTRRHRVACRTHGHRWSVIRMSKLSATLQNAKNGERRSRALLAWLSSHRRGFRAP